MLIVLRNLSRICQVGGTLLEFFSYNDLVNCFNTFLLHIFFSFLVQIVFVIISQSGNVMLDSLYIFLVFLLWS